MFLVFVALLQHGLVSGLPVCIVGGGIGGASTAFFLSKDKVSDILLVERSSRLGGRFRSAKTTDSFVSSSVS